MNIRCAKITDFDRIVHFYKNAIEKTPELKIHARWVYGQHPTDAMIQSYIEQKSMYIIEENQTIIGAMALTMYQSEDYRNINWSINIADNEAAVIHILCINPDYQKQGIGKRMVNEGINLAKKEMKKAVRLDALESNVPAYQMYQTLGFEYRGKQHLYAKNTGWTDFLFFEYTIKQ